MSKSDLLDLLRKSLPILRTAAASRQIHSATVAASSQVKPSFSFIVFGTDHRDTASKIAMLQLSQQLAANNNLNKTNTALGFEVILNGISDDIAKQLIPNLNSPGRVKSFLDIAYQEQIRNGKKDDESDIETKARLVEEVISCLWKDFSRNTGIKRFGLETLDTHIKMRTRMQEVGKDKMRILSEFEKERMGI